MSKLKQLQEAAQAAAKAARETAEKADREGRALTDAERTEYDQHMAKGRDLLEQIKVAKRDAEVNADDVGDIEVQAEEFALRVGDARHGAERKSGGRDYGDHPLLVVHVELPSLVVDDPATWLLPRIARSGQRHQAASRRIVSSLYRHFSSVCYLRHRRNTANP